MIINIINPQMATTVEHHHLVEPATTIIYVAKTIAIVIDNHATTIANHCHNHCQPLPIIATTIANHCKSLPQPLSTITNHCQSLPQPLPIIATTIVNHCQSLPQPLSTITNHCQSLQQPLPTISNHCHCHLWRRTLLFRSSDSFQPRHHSFQSFQMLLHCSRPNWNVDLTFPSIDFFLGFIWTWRF